MKTVHVTKEYPYPATVIWTVKSQAAKDAENIVEAEHLRGVYEYALRQYGDVVLRSSIFDADILTALELARMGYPVHRPQSALDKGFFWIEVGETSVFVNIPK